MSGAGMFLRFLYSQIFVTPKAPTQSFAGKTVIVTGSNVGLGKEAARHIVRLSAATVILAVRNLEKGEEAKRDIVQSEKVNPDVVEVWQLDLGSFDSVMAFAKRASSLPRLDALLENAGITTYNFKLVEGHESTITVNVISTFLLALLMLPKLKETAAKFDMRPHLTIVSSETHFWAAFTEGKGDEIFKTLSTKETANMVDRYQVSKLLEVFAVREITDGVIADKQRYPVTINYVTPGLCHSELMREGIIVAEIAKFALARSTEVGARTLAHAAGEAGAESMGEFMFDNKVWAPSAYVRSEEGGKMQKRVWTELSGILENIAPGVTSNI